MGIAVVIFKVDTTFAQTFCHSSLLQCRLEAEQCVSQPSSLSGCSLTKLLANTHSAAPCSATPNYFWAPGLLLHLRGNYRTHTPLQNNRAEDCNITHDFLQLETYIAVDLAHSYTDAGGRAQWILLWFYTVPKHLTHCFGIYKPTLKEHLNIFLFLFYWRQNLLLHLQDH